VSPAVYVNGLPAPPAFTAKKITIDSDRVASTESNFPVLATTTDPDLRFTGSGGHAASSTGGDLYFTAADGTTVLNYEREYYSSTTGELVCLGED